MSLESSNKKALEWKVEKANKLAQFDELLADISGASAKDKILWRQIYENAIQDRNLSLGLVLSLYNKFMADSDQHMQNGSQMNGYLQRMKDSNKQLLELAHLIAENRQEEDSMNKDDLFAAMKEEDKEEVN